MSAPVDPIDLLARYYLKLSERVEALERQNETLQLERVKQAQEISALRLALIGNQSTVLTEMVSTAKRVESTTMVAAQPQPPAIIYHERSRRKRASAPMAPVPLSKRDPAIADRWRKLSFA